MVLEFRAEREENDRARRLVLMTAWVVAIASTAAYGEPPGDKPLVAHWTFDEPGPSAVIRNVSAGPASDATPDRAVPRARGVQGGALALSGSHALKVDLGLESETLSAVTFSAWTRPTDLGSYREIFRQECPRRLLFSYQHDGTILSLGLNVDGSSLTGANKLYEKVGMRIAHRFTAFEKEIRPGREISRQ